MNERTEKILSRLDLIKDLDPFNKKMLNDCRDIITFNKKMLNDCRDIISDLQDEVDRLIYHNNNLMNVIYQNQSELEN